MKSEQVSSELVREAYSAPTLKCFSFETNCLFSISTAAKTFEEGAESLEEESEDADEGM